MSVTFICHNLFLITEIVTFDSKEKKENQFFVGVCVSNQNRLLLLFVD